MSEIDEVKLDDRVAMVTLAGQRIMQVSRDDDNLYMTLEDGTTVMVRSSEGCDSVSIFKLIKRTNKLKDPDATKNTN